MLQKIDAIVLTKLKYSESDLIVKCFTKQRGVESYLLKGVLKSKKGKLKPALFIPITQLQIEERYRENSSLQSINEAKLSYTYTSIHTNVFKSTIIMFLSEVLTFALKEEKQNIGLFNYLITSFQILDQEDSFVNFHLLFLVKLSKHLGIYPKEDNEGNPYFNIIDGNFESFRANNYCLKGENVELLKVLLGMNFDSVKEIKINANQRQTFLSLMLLYFEYHIPGFKKPKSLDVLSSVFN
jgi:DNA repair protein RecO (recombination protein O)